ASSNSSLAQETEILSGSSSGFISSSSSSTGTTGIGVNDCPERLRHFLLGFNEVLEGRGEKLSREKPFLTRSAEEELEKELKIFASIQAPLENGRFQSLDMELTDKFTNVEQGKGTFEQIAKSVTNKHDEIDEIATEIDSSGWTKKQEFVLIHRNARENDFDPEGNLNLSNNPIYRANRFNRAEIDEINKFLNINSQQNYLASLIKQRKETKDKILGDIEEVTRFKT
ncbi:5398_t:CDS:2, partial [Ambispora leptoticha]